MKIRKVQAKTAAPIARFRAIEPELNELLDHLGRLLAKEYVRLLSAADEAGDQDESR